MPHQLTNTAAWQERISEIEAHVGCRLCGRVRDFQVVPRNGGLILKGVAHTFHAKQLAQHAVMEATDLQIMANEIQVT